MRFWPLFGEKQGHPRTTGCTLTWGAVSPLFTIEDSNSITRLGGESADITVTPDPLDLGDVVIGMTGTQTEALPNAGTKNLMVTHSTQAAAPFALSGGTCNGTLPFILARGSNCA